MAANYSDNKELRKVVSKALYQFAEKGLKARDVYTEEGTQLAQNVFLCLQKESKKFSVASVLFSGSFAKKTEVIQPDLDLVVKVNNFEPPLKYKDVLDEFENILDLNEDRLEIREGTISQATPYSVQFVFKNGIEVDLLPAANLEPHQVLEIISGNPNNYYHYSLCFARKQVEFVKSHESSFVHCLIRLIKFWKKSLVGLGKMSGGSYIMELVGIAAAEEEEKLEDPDILRAFTRVMDWFCKLNKMRLTFREISENKWVRVSANECGSYSACDPFIIDPTNPYNDLLKCQKEDKIAKLMGYAKETRKRLDDLMNGHQRYWKYNESANKIVLDILQLFKSQPFQATLEFRWIAPKDFLIDHASPCSSLTCDLNVRNEQVYKNVEVRNCVEATKWNLFCAVNSATFASHGDNNQQVKTDVSKSVKDVIQESFKVNLVPGTGSHENFHVTISVPYRVGEASYAVKCSLQWK